MLIISWQGKFNRYKYIQIDLECFSNHDLILVEGSTIQSKLIRLFSTKPSAITHIGIIQKKGNEIFVLHATPNRNETNGICYDSIHIFLNKSQATNWQILRSRTLSRQMHAKLDSTVDRLKNQVIPFDHSFNNIDHSEIYCSELVLIALESMELTNLKYLDLKIPIHPSKFEGIIGFKQVVCIRRKQQIIQ